MDKEYNVLIKNALDTRRFSYAPYSKFYVGASLLTSDGSIFNGCNVENASYSLTMCAERNAIFKAVSNGYQDFRMICVVGGFDINTVSEYCYPCGACIQVMTELCTPDFKIILFDGNHLNVYALRELFPHNFTNLT